MMITSNRWVVCLSALTLVLGPCDEALPPHSEPEIILEGSLSGLYIFPGAGNRPENKLAVYFTFTNVYDETLQDTINFQGSIEIRSARIPTIKKIYEIGVSNLHSGSQYYNSTTRILTIDPGKSITFAVFWDFAADDNGIDARQMMFEFFTDPNCQTLCLAAKEDLIVTGELFVFDERAPVQVTTVMPFCYAVGDPCGAFVADPLCFHEPALFWPKCYPFLAN